MLGQLLTLFGFFSLILVLVYWINRAVILFDQLIADGQSAAVFLELSALSLPTVIRLALPLSAFAASVYVTNKLTTDSELVVLRATGFSVWRLARAPLIFGVIVAVMMSLLMHLLVPLSVERLSLRQSEIARNATARLLVEGQFLEPARGVTVYIGEVTPSGELRDLFLSDTRTAGSETLYTAAQAYVVRDEDRAQIVMVDGLVQQFREADRRLTTTSFADFAYDISELVVREASDRRPADALSTAELLNPTKELARETRRTEASLISRGHDRFAQSALAGVAAMLGFAALMTGGFSRFGVWRQIIMAIFLIILIKAVESWGLTLARNDESFWIATYFATIFGIFVVWSLLFVASRPTLFQRRRAEGTA